MMKPNFILCVFFAGVAILPLSAQDQCGVTLQDDVPGGCLDSACGEQCAGRRLIRATLNPVVPGFFTEQSPTGYIISAVVPNSPASKAGLLPGDQVVSVDGQPLAIFCPVGAELWQKQMAHKITIRRNSQTFTELVTPNALSDVVAGAALDAPKRALATEEALTQPYVSGLLTRLAKGHLMVAAVLRGSSAERAGVLEGDEILSFGDVRILDPLIATSLEGDDHRTLVRLRVDRKGSSLDFRFQMGSLMDMLHKLAERDNVSRIISGGAF